MIKQVIVVGGGPAGMFSAITAAQGGADVTIIERNEQLGKKLLITGKGRCNVTNYCDCDTFLANINHNPKFLYSAFNAFSAMDCYSYFEQRGVPLKVERGARVFPQSDKSQDIKNALEGHLDELGINRVIGRVVKISAKGGGFIVSCESEKYSADAVIVATGGKSYPKTGSTGDGYKLAQSLGHTIIPPAGALVGLKEKGGMCRRMAGLTLKNCAVQIINDNNKKCVYKDFGELLFTHTGVSGPTVLSASSKLDDFESGFELIIDLKPALTFEKLDARILRDFELFKNRNISNGLSKLLPRKCIPVILNITGIPAETKVNRITRFERQALVSTIKAFKIKLWSKERISEAIVTAGGINVNEITPQTMESKLVQGLYFAGEVLDLDALTGGFNLQIAWSTAYAAGSNIW